MVVGRALAGQSMAPWARSPVRVGWFVRNHQNINFKTKGAAGYLWLSQGTVALTAFWKCFCCRQNKQKSFEKAFLSYTKNEALSPIGYVLNRMVCLKQRSLLQAELCCLLQMYFTKVPSIYIRTGLLWHGFGPPLLLRCCWNTLLGASEYTLGFCQSTIQRLYWPPKGHLSVERLCNCVTVEHHQGILAF